MTLAELRAAFPVLRERAYLFSGGLAPLAEQVRAAHEAMLSRWQNEPAELYATLGEPWQAGRAAFAAVLGAHPDEIALTDGTSRGSNLAVQMLDVQPGENVVCDDSTYWSSAVPWRLRARAGTEVRRVRARADARVHPATSPPRSTIAQPSSRSRTSRSAPACGTISRRWQSSRTPTGRCSSSISRRPPALSRSTCPPSASTSLRASR